jgi:hypothetical protein
VSESADATPAVEFDVDAWLTEAKPPQRAVVVYGRGDLLSQLQALEADIKANPDDSPRMGGDPRRAQMRRMHEQIQASRRVLHVRGLLEDERASLAERYTTRTKGEDGEESESFDAKAYEAEAYALALVDPVMSVEQVRRMHPRIGEAQWTAIGSEITRASVETIDVPLSRLGSGDTPGS